MSRYHRRLIEKIERKVRRMYLPDRVSGKAETTRKSEGTAVAPFSIAPKTAVLQDRHQKACARSRDQECNRRFAFFIVRCTDDNNVTDWGVLAQCLSRKMAPSISSVPIR